MRKQRETDIVNACLQFLKLHKIPAWRFNSGSATFGQGTGSRFVRFHTAKGCSDILGIAPHVLHPWGNTLGRFMAIEVKRPGEKPTTLQLSFLETVRLAGGLALVVHDPTELQAALKQAGVI